MTICAFIALQVSFVSSIIIRLIPPFSEFQLVLERTECDGNKIGECRQTTAEQCVMSCKNISSMVSFGRQGSDMCSSKGQCRCYCQLEAVNGSCNQRFHHSFDLYRYFPEMIATPDEPSDEHPSKFSS